MKEITPSHIQIETVAGYCNLSCVMCPIEKSIRHGIMSNTEFEEIVKRLLPIKDKIKLFTILGLGETLIDKYTPEKIQIAKSYGFKDIGIFTNGMLLHNNTALELLLSGVTSIVFSIDGYSKEVQKSIRIGSNLDTIIKNIDYLIKCREKFNFKTKIVIRFTKQDKNKHEWNDFLTFWSEKLDKKYGDIVLSYDVHNAGGSLDILSEQNSDKKIICPEVYNRMIIFSDGNIGLCCGDQFGHYNIGNILKEDPVKLYNHEVFQQYRKEMNDGNILNLDLCKSCTVMYSIENSKHVEV